MALCGVGYGRKVTRRLILVLAASAGFMEARADVIFDAFDTQVGGFHPTDNLVAARVDDSFLGLVSIRAAVRFSVVGRSYALDSVSLPIAVSGNIPDDIVRVRITNDVGGAPGVTLEVLSDGEDIWPPLTNPFTTVTTLLSTTHPLLEANQSYWIVVEPNAIPAASPPYVAGASWFENSTNNAVPALQQQTFGALPADPWPGSTFDFAAAFRVEGTSQGPLEIACTPVGDPGNACDPQSGGCFGAVSHSYAIGTYEVVNAEYAAFLNAIAATDVHGVYDEAMFRIHRSGSPGAFTYGVDPGHELEPVGGVTFYDALRFANWLHNGQPAGAQDATTTEDGAYTFSGATSVGSRNPGALFALGNEDEWYKAAYYDAGSSSYRSWPTGSINLPICSTPTATPDRANCDQQVGAMTDAGSYPGSASAYGTFDQGGNAWEWNESEIDVGGVWQRGIRGGAFHLPDQFMASFARLSLDPATPSADITAVGFRVVCLPEPRTAAPLLAGIALLWAVARKREPRMPPRSSEFARAPRRSVGGDAWAGPISKRQVGPGRSRPSISARGTARSILRSQPVASCSTGAGRIT